VLSRSASALVLLSIFLTAAGIYVLWKRDALLGQAASLMVVLALSLMAIILWIDPQFAFGLMGKDAGLTGRTELWDVLIPLIKAKLMLGYGYRAMWAADDPYKALVDRLTGNWGVTTAHNAFAEIALELGLMGLGIMLAIIVVAFWRSIKCCSSGLWLLGWFSFAYFAATVIGGVTEDTLGMNQNLYWLMFNVLFFSCGLKSLPGNGKVMGEPIDRTLTG
jgi:exopolysaccharide production protein ExoQ